MVPPAGRRDRRITLRTLDPGPVSVGGEPSETPRVVATPWAEKITDRGMEAFRQDQTQAWSTVIWRTLYFLDGTKEPTPKWELLEGSRSYEILEVREIGRREGWEFVTRYRAEDQRVVA